MQMKFTDNTEFKPTIKDTEEEFTCMPTCEIEICKRGECKLYTGKELTC